jgi:hypothetical protein
MNAEAMVASRQFMAVAERLPTLYALADEWNELVALLEDPESDQAAIGAELDRVASDIHAKAYGLAVVIQGFQLRAEYLKAEEQRLYAKRKASESHVERLRAYALAQMQALGMQRIDTGSFTYQVKSNPPAVSVVDAALVPSEYERTKITVDVDKRSILDDYKRTGEIPPGVDIRRGVRLEIS